MSDVVQLPIHDEASRKCAELLRQAMEVAENGEMKAVFITYLGTDRAVRSASEHDEQHFMTLVGAISAGQHDMLSEAHDD